jgi:uncharacterized protein YbjQ (UPF0145 family)
MPSQPTQSSFQAASVFSTLDVPGRVIEQSYGMVSILASIGAFVGGIEDAFQSVVERATAMGGNAVVGLRIEPLDGFILIYGTAVRLKGREQPESFVRTQLFQ